jgi:hypothetical protein
LVVDAAADGLDRAGTANGPIIGGSVGKATTKWGGDGKAPEQLSGGLKGGFRCVG